MRAADSSPAIPNGARRLPGWVYGEDVCLSDALQRVACLRPLWRREHVRKTACEQKSVWRDALSTLHAVLRADSVSWEGTRKKTVVGEWPGLVRYLPRAYRLRGKSRPGRAGRAAGNSVRKVSKLKLGRDSRNVFSLVSNKVAFSLASLQPICPPPRFFLNPTTTCAMVRAFKYHEKKLLKKVDFLNVCRIWGFLSSVAKPAHSGSKMPTYAKSRLCAGTTYRIVKTITSAADPYSLRYRS
jgi:hypothetical protein